MTQIEWIKRFNEKFGFTYYDFSGPAARKYEEDLKSFISSLLTEVIESIPEATKDFGEIVEFNDKDQSKFSYAVLYHNARIGAIKEQLKSRYGI